MKKSIIFPNLNGLRFIAALMVIIHHIEQVKQDHGVKNIYWDTPWATSFGSLGVTLFFCLSGFLITYLLLAERNVSGTISIKDFYVRRLLRIWPLYFLIIFLAFVVLYRIPFFVTPRTQMISDANYWILLAYFITFTPNLLVFSIMPFASQCWSIGVEEQFYAVWPLIMKFLKRPIYLVGAIIIIFVALNVFVDFVLITLVPGRTFSLIRVMLTHCRFDCMAIGAVFANILYYNENGKIISFIFRKDIQAATYLIALYLLLKNPIILGVGHLPYAVIFSIIIVNLAANKHSIVNIEYPVFDYLGKISYGLYMFHPIVIFMCVKIIYLQRYTLDINSLTKFNLIAYPISAIMTIFISAISYHLYEKRFLLLKHSFSTLISGDNVRDSETALDIMPIQVTSTEIYK